MTTATPALDFLEKVRTWQEADGASSGLPLVIPESAEGRLSAILADMDRGYNRADLETRARRWLIGYHELVEQQGGLTPEQQRELNSIVTCIPLWNTRQQHEQHRSGWELTWPPGRQVVLTIIAVIIVVAASLSVSALLIGSSNGSPPAAGAPVNPAQQPAQGPLTDLQQFRADWNVPSAASPSAGGINAQNLVLLQDGLYYPTPWVIPPGDAGWTADSSGTISAASAHDGYADVTDSDGTTYTVPVGEPFTVASNPQLVFRILRDGTIQSMPQPHAIRVRYRI
jgi:hypothetical protein